MYFAQYKVKVRAKNRIAFPVRLKKDLGDTFYLTNWFENTIIALSKRNFEKLGKELFAGASFLQPEVRDLDRFLLGGTFEVRLDDEGRFILPRYLKDYAGIQKNVVFVGSFWGIQIWDLNMFENYRAINNVQIKDKALKAFKTLRKSQIK